MAKSKTCNVHIGTVSSGKRKVSFSVSVDQSRMDRETAHLLFEEACLECEFIFDPETGMAHNPDQGTLLPTKPVEVGGGFDAAGLSCKSGMYKTVLSTTQDLVTDAGWVKLRKIAGREVRGSFKYKGKIENDVAEVGDEE
jgi:hypothetical protein